MYLCGIGQYEAGNEAARIGLALADRFVHLPEKTSGASYVLGVYVMGWSRPVRQSIPVLEKGFRAGAEGGRNQPFAAFLLHGKCLNLFFAGHSLDNLLAETAVSIDYAKRVKNTIASDCSRAIGLGARNLSGLTAEKFGFDDDSYDCAEAFIRGCQERESNSALCQFLIYGAQIHYMYGQSGAAMEYLEQAEPLVPFLLNNLDAAKFVFYKALALADLALADPGQHSEHIRPLREQLAGWAASCPENFSHKLSLVDAELARMEGRVGDGVALYEAAIEEAEKEGFVHLVALAKERTALFWLGQNNLRIARVYMQEAHYGYRKWGAHRKVEDLEERFENLLPTERGEEGTARTRETRDRNETVSRSETLDALSIIKISQTIASQLEVEQLLASLMGVTLETAGARLGALFWPEDVAGGELVVAVQSRGADAEPEVLPNTALEDWVGGPRSVVNYVRRTARTLVIGDIETDERFNKDPFLAAHSVKSVLCLPVKHRSEIRGVLYLANDLAQNAFTPRHVEVLQVLASQCAIAIENATLYSGLKLENSARRRAEHRLE